MPPGIVEADLQTLSGGKAAAQVNDQLLEVIQDVINRPSLKTARTVTLKISVKPCGLLVRTVLLILRGLKKPTN